MSETPVTVPFVSFRPMERELDADLRGAFARVLDNSWYIEGKEDAAFEAAFADSLRRSLRKSIQLAGGMTKAEQKARKNNNTGYHRAKEWFVSSYPLLGAVAAGFQLVDDLAVVQRMRVPIAAVNARLQEL